MLRSGSEDALKTLGEEITVMTSKSRHYHVLQTEAKTKLGMVERVKSKAKEAYALTLILLLNPGEAKTESDSTKAS